MTGADARSSFSIASAAYAHYRPHYPPELFAWIASACSDHRAAWDCATGNGQAAVALAAYFDAVEATDISPAQVAQDFHAPNVRYTAQPAERTDFGDGAFDLVAVAQALHWFDFAGFWPEVRRVARAGAFFCAWGYSWFRSDPELHERFMDPLLEQLGPHWAPENGLLWRGYPSEEIGFPFERVEAPRFSIRLSWDIAAIAAYIRTWSAYKRALADPETAASIGQLEGDALQRFAERGAFSLDMPLAVVGGRIV